MWVDALERTTQATCVERVWVWSLLGSDASGVKERWVAELLMVGGSQAQYFENMAGKLQPKSTAEVPLLE